MAHDLILGMVNPEDFGITFEHDIYAIYNIYQPFYVDVRID